MDNFDCKTSMPIDNVSIDKDEFQDVKSKESGVQSDDEIHDDINYGIVLSLEAQQEKEITLKD